MSAAENHDLAERLARAESLKDRPRMPPVPLRVRLKTSPPLRRLLPTSLVVRRAEQNAARVWRTSAWDREDSLETMAAILGDRASAEDMERLAKAHLVEREVIKALFWQPWPVPRIVPEQRARLRAALDGPRPVILSVCHQGPYFCTALVAISMGYAPYVVAGEWYFAEPSHDYWGRRLARWRRAARVHLVSARGSYPVLRALLARGECVMLYYDMPGPRASRFLGKPAELADGTARLARETNAIVLPMRMVRHGHRAHLEVGEVFDAAGFEHVEQLHRALGEFHERWIREFPPRMDDPRKYGWGSGATPSEWKAPQSRRSALPA
jgi:lauroyl/myristoyl acyltransferase